MKTVIIQLTGPHRSEGGDQFVGDARHFHAPQLVVLQFEVLNPGRRAIGPAQAIRTFRDDPQAEMFECRQHFRHRQRIAPSQDAQMQSLLTLLRRTIQPQLHLLDRVVDAFQIADIFDRERGIDILPLGIGERGGVATLQNRGLELLRSAPARTVRSRSRQFDTSAAAIACSSLPSSMRGLLSASTRTTTCSCASGESPIADRGIDLAAVARRAQNRLDARLCGRIAPFARQVDQA